MGMIMVKQRPAKKPLRQQRGAVAVFVAIFIVALIAVMLLVLDIGRLYYAQRQLENEANLAALAGAQIVSGCSGDATTKGTPSEVTTADVKTAVLQSLTNNRGTVGSFADLGDPATLLTTGINGYPSVELGQTVYVPVLAADGKSSILTRTFKPLADGDPNIDSVRVNLSTLQPTPYLLSFFPGMATGKRIYASATAKQGAVGSFFVGTALAGLHGGLLNDVLGGLLCAPGDTNCQQNVISLDLASSASGLASVNVSLGQLATALGVSVKDLSDPVALSTHTPVLSDVLNGLANALGSTASASVTGLLSNLAGAVNGNRQQIPLGRILGAVDDLAANTPFVNLSSLIVALGAAAQAGPNGQVQPIALPVDLSVQGVATVSSFLSIGAPPKLGGPGPAGSTTASTAEATVMVRIGAGALLSGLVNSVTSLLKTLLGLVGSLVGISTQVTALSSSLNLGVDVAVAPATASLDTLQCPAISGNPVAGLSATTAIATVKIGTFSGNATDAPALDTSQTNFPLVDVKIDATHVLLLGNLGSTDLKLGLSLTALGVGGSGMRTLAPVTEFSLLTPGSNLPPYYLADGAPSSSVSASDNPQTIGSPISVSLNLGLTHQQTGSGLVGVLGGLVNSLISGITGLVQPLLDLVNGLSAALIDPLLNALGIQLGAATVTMNTAIFSQPTIQTNCLPGVAGATGCPVVQ